MLDFVLLYQIYAQITTFFIKRCSVRFLSKTLTKKHLAENDIIMTLKHNQRTSGPVNAHLTAGPGIYSHALIYVYIGQGQTTPWGQMLMSTESPYHFAHLLQVLKQSL